MEWDKVAAIGIVIITMILIITIISKQLEHKNWKQVAFMTVGSIATITGILVGIYSLFMAAFVLTITVPLIETAYKYVKTNPHKFDFIRKKIPFLGGDK